MSKAKKYAAKQDQSKRNNGSLLWNVTILLSIDLPQLCLCLAVFLKKFHPK